MTLRDKILPQLHRVYRSPHDIMRDRRFSDADKLVLLDGWASEDEIAAQTVEMLKAEIRARMP
jgi:hypothetical protein